jgi:hypothetical protein
MADRAYKQLWSVVDGAVSDAFNRHPDYLTKKGRFSARVSIVKRVTGTVLSFALQEAERQRELAATTGGHASGLQQAEGVTASSAADDEYHAIRTHSYVHVNERCYQAIRRALFPVGRRSIRKDAKQYVRALADTTTSLKHAFPSVARSIALRQGRG